MGHSVCTSIPEAKEMNSETICTNPLFYLINLNNDIKNLAKQSQWLDTKNGESTPISDAGRAIIKRWDILHTALFAVIALCPNKETTSSI